MNLLIDIGNTLCKWALADEHGIVEKGFTVIFNECYIESLLAKGKQFDTVVICSVRTLSERLEEYLSARFKYVRVAHTLDLPLKINYATPETLGMDRVVAAVGANALYQNVPLLIIDAGTAITIDYVSASGEFLGGNIAPGIRLRYQSLHDYTDKLPLVNAQPNFEPIGKNTESAIRAGVQQGVINELQGYIRSAQKQFPSLHVVLTGGDAQLLSDKLTENLTVESELIFIGLQQVALSLC
ncbi:MAG: type III pantothenate kinase [Mangrovibacterium sp.]